MSGARHLCAAVAGLAALVAAAAGAAAGPTCAEGPPGDRYATCFDLGRRLAVGGELAVGEGDGPGGTAFLAFRHLAATVDPAVGWRLEHVVLDTRWAGDSLDVALYRGRFIRHSRDGRILIPVSPPRKIYLPFDLGAEADVGVIASREGGERLEVGVVRTGLFVELLRSTGFARRLTVGVAGRWDLVALGPVDDLGVAEHRVAPLTLATAALHLESDRGLTALDLAVEGGRTWSTVAGWRSAATASATLERVLLSVNDRPVSLLARASWADPGLGASASLGLRIGVVAATTPP